MAEGDKIFIADKETLDSVSTKIGSTTNTGGTTSAGTVFGKLNAIISSIASFVANWTAARAAKMDNLDAKVSTRQSEQNAYDRFNILNASTGVNNTASATGTLSQKISHAINAIATRQSESDAASRYNTLNGNTAINNTSSATGTLSQKLSHIINLFSTNKQKVLVSKVVSIELASAGTHTLVNVAGSGKFDFAYVKGMGESYAPITFEIDGNQFVFNKIINPSYVAQIYSGMLLSDYTSLPFVHPIHFKNSLKITVAASNQNQLSFKAHYSVYE